MVIKYLQNKSNRNSLKYIHIFKLKKCSFLFKIMSNFTVINSNGNFGIIRVILDDGVENELQPK